MGKPATNRRHRSCSSACSDARQVAAFVGGAHWLSHIGGLLVAGDGFELHGGGRITATLSVMNHVAKAGVKMIWCPVEARSRITVRHQRPRLRSRQTVGFDLAAQSRFDSLAPSSCWRVQPASVIGQRHRQSRAFTGLAFGFAGFLPKREKNRRPQHAGASFLYRGVPLHGQGRKNRRDAVFVWHFTTARLHHCSAGQSAADQFRFQRASRMRMCSSAHLASEHRKQARQQRSWERTGGLLNMGRPGVENGSCPLPT